MVKIGMATIPSRQESAQQAIKSLEGQGDIYVTFNGFDAVPDWASLYDITPRLEPSNVGDMGKFLFPQEGYCFTTDDDIIYPENYVERTTASLDYYKGRIVGYHGKRIQGDKYYQFPVLHFRLNVPHDLDVDILGTGVMAWHSDTITFPESAFTLFNDADTNAAVYAKKQGVGKTCLSHNKNMFEPIFHDSNIWDGAYERNEEVMAKLGEAYA